MRNDNYTITRHGALCKASVKHPHKMMVDKALDLIQHIGSLRGKARAIPVPDATMRRWMEGDYGVPLRKTLGPLRAFLTRHGAMEEGMDFGEGLGPDGRHVVAIDESGLPLEDELEQLRNWLPAEATRRLSRQTTDRAWLGALYAHGIDEGWPKERLDRVDAARRRVDALRSAEDQE